MPVSLKPQTPKTGIKELAVMKANCCIILHCLCFGQKVALEHSTKATVDSQLAYTFCTCRREINSPAGSCSLYSPFKKGKRKTKEFHTTLTHHLDHYLDHYSWSSVAIFQMVILLRKYSCTGMINERWEEPFVCALFALVVCMISPLLFLFWLSWTANQSDFSYPHNLPSIQHSQSSEKPLTRDRVVPTMQDTPRKPKFFIQT